MCLLAARGMAYHFASINDSTDKMMAIFKDAFLAGGGEPELFQVMRLNDTSAAFWQHRPRTPAAEAAALATELLQLGTQSFDDRESLAPAVMRSIQHSATASRSPRPSPRSSRLRRQAQGRQGPY